MMSHSHSLHFLSRSIPGCEYSCLPCLGFSGQVVSISQKHSHGDFRLIADLKFSSSLRCNASSGGDRRNPDFSRQNKRGFSRNRSRSNEGYEEFQESETRNGSAAVFVSGNQTSGSGAREKEIVELFRKVQAQLRERAAVKEERKVEEAQTKSNESNTVDSLLKLLRKHSVQQGKKNSGATNKRDFVLDQDEPANTSVEQEIEQSPQAQPQISRPRSSFQKRSPVPAVKFQGVYPDSKQMDVEAEDDDPLFPEDEMYEEEENVVESNDLSGMKLTELRALAKSRGIKGFSKLKKNDLIDVLSRPV